MSFKLSLNHKSNSLYDYHLVLKHVFSPVFKRCVAYSVQLFSAQCCELLYKQDRRNIQGVLQPSKSSLWNSNEVQSEAVLQVYSNFAQSYSIKAKHPAESGVSSTDQQSMVIFVSRWSKFDSRRAEQTTAIILKKIAKDALNIGFVEGEGFQSLMAFVEHKFTVPSTESITTEMECVYVRACIGGREVWGGSSKNGQIVPCE